MTDPKFDKPILKLTGLLLVSFIVLVLYKIQMEAFCRGINGTVLITTSGILGGAITACIVIIRGWRKR